MDYSEIWFMGLSSQKIEGSQGAPQNCGYDDEHGSYIRVMRNVLISNPILCTFICILKPQRLSLVAKIYNYKGKKG